VSSKDRIDNAGYLRIKETRVVMSMWWAWACLDLLELE
jgi:hypothetical protein